MFSNSIFQKIVLLVAFVGFGAMASGNGVATAMFQYQEVDIVHGTLQSSVSASVHAQMFVVDSDGLLGVELCTMTVTVHMTDDNGESWIFASTATAESCTAALSKASSELKEFIEGRP